MRTITVTQLADCLRVPRIRVHRALGRINLRPVHVAGITREYDRTKAMRLVRRELERVDRNMES